jgi:dipeptidyl aminopeptidase/acylaminoacyl peptidase
VLRLSVTNDEHLWLIAASGDTEPGETYLFDRTNHNLTLQFKVRENLPRESLAEMKLVSLTFAVPQICEGKLTSLSV